MEKSKNYQEIKFSSRIIRKAYDACKLMSSDKEPYMASCNTKIDDETWKFDSIEEFLASYSRPDVDEAVLHAIWSGTDVSLYLHYGWGQTTVGVKNSSRPSIEQLFSFFEEAPDDDKIHVDERGPKATIFIGHGGSKQWEKVKSHLQDKHDLEVIAYETGARAGHSIRDILDDMAEDSSFAILVLTGEDKTADGKLRARQNVIHECGLFQGRLGFDRAILLVEQGVELGSNFDGIQQLRFRKGRISETFGDILATIRREFGAF